jgi:hypothetical protein
MKTPIPIELLTHLETYPRSAASFSTQLSSEDIRKKTDLELCIEDLQDFTISQLNELSQEIRKARKRLKYDDRAKELAK